MSMKQAIDDFLAQRRIGIVGVSRGKNDFSRGLLREMRMQGYDTVPVNPNAEEIEGLKCFPSVRDINPPVDGVLVMVPGNEVESVVRDCAAAGVKRVWLHGMDTVTDPGEPVRALCGENGITLIPGQCPYMFLAETAWIHRLHARIWKWFGKYPA